MKPVLFPLIALLLAASACTRYEYTKPGMTEEVFTQDSRECAEIARDQAFRDYARDFRHPPIHRRGLHGRSAFLPYPIHPSPAELEHRYRRVCMTARGYELVPVAEP
jgi:hypothetical protein